MKMERCRHEMKCDFYGCKNMAKYSFSMKGFLRRDLMFCEDCMKSMFECFSKECVPKAIESPFKKKRKEKR